MRRIAVRTGPMPYSKSANTFRFCDAGQRPAARARLGSLSFGNDFDQRSKGNPFVQKHLSERRPTRIVNGLRHSRLGKLGRAHVSYDNMRKFSNQPGREFVQKILALISHLRGHGLRAARHAEALEPGKLFLGLPVVLRRLDLATVAQCGERLKAEVNAYFWPILARAVRQLKRDVEVPSSAIVARKGRGFYRRVGRYRPAEPEVIFALQEGQHAAS